MGTSGNAIAFLDLNRGLCGTALQTSASRSDEVSERVVRVCQPRQLYRLAHTRVYQLDFTTPGISPLSASDRKHRRQTPNLRRNARGRPHNWQRLCWRDLNFGFLASLTRFAVVAIMYALYSVTDSPIANSVVRGMRTMRQPGTAYQSPLAAPARHCRRLRW
jgi:hypothetical protein